MDFTKTTQTGGEMNTPNRDIQEIMNEMLETPIQIHVCIVNFQDGSSRAYTFSTEENLAVFLENLEETAQEHNIVSYVFYESLVDVEYDSDYTHYTTWH